MFRGIRAGGVLLAALAAISATSPAAAQSLYTEGRALEFRTDQPWARLVFEGNERIAGVSPLRVPGPLTGDFWLTASGPGVEPQRGRVRIRLDEEGSRITSYGGLPVHETIMRSLLFPGYPQFRSQQKGKGTLLAAAGALAVGRALWAQTEFWDSEDLVFEAERVYNGSGIDVDRAESLKALRDAEGDRDYAEGRRNLYLSAAGAIWGLGLVDALLFAPGFEVSRADENSISLGMKRKTRFDAVLRSALLPGLGQSYNGQRKKGALVALGAIGMTWWALREQDDYDDAVHELDKIDERFSGATTVDERNTLADLRKSVFEDVDDAYRNRNLIAGIAGAYWALNVLDAAISHDDPWGTNRTRPTGGTSLGWSADPVRGRLAARIRF